jgi:hypothetical protein
MVSCAGDQRDPQFGAISKVAPDSADLGVAPDEGGGRSSFGLGDRDEQDAVVAPIKRERLILIPVGGSRRSSWGMSLSAGETSVARD